MSREFRGSPKSLGLILWEPFMSKFWTGLSNICWGISQDKIHKDSSSLAPWIFIPDFIAIHPIGVEIFILDQSGGPTYSWKLTSVSRWWSYGLRNSWPQWCSAYLKGRWAQGAAHQTMMVKALGWPSVWLPWLRPQISSTLVYIAGDDLLSPGESEQWRQPHSNLESK